MGNKSYANKRGMQQLLWSRGQLVQNSVQTWTKAFTRVGINNPRYKSQIRDSRNASTPMTVSTFDVTVPSAPECDVSYTVREPPSWIPYRTFDRAVGFYNLWDSSEITSHFGVQDPEAERRAISLLYRKIQGATHQFQGGVFAGEFKKTVTMIAYAGKNFQKNVLSYVTSAKKIRNSALTSNRQRVNAANREARLRNAQGSIQNAYLEAVFGWGPLYQDLQDGCQALARLLYEKPRVRFRAAAGTEIPISQIAGKVTQIVTYQTLDKRSRETAVTFYGAFKIASEDDMGFSQAQRAVALSGFDLRSFVPTLWELVPYSFLVDYFVNIGELIEAASTDVSLVAWVSKVVRNRSVSEVILSYTGPSAAQKAYYGNGSSTFDPVFNGSSGRCIREYVSISRSPLDSVPVLMPRLKFADLSGKQLLNMGALLTRA